MTAISRLIVLLIVMLLTEVDLKSLSRVVDWKL